MLFVFFFINRDNIVKKLSLSLVCAAALATSVGTSFAMQMDRVWKPALCSFAGGVAMGLVDARRACLDLLDYEPREDVFTGSFSGICGTSASLFFGLRRADKLALDGFEVAKMAALYVGSFQAGYLGARTIGFELLLIHYTKDFA